MYITKKLIHLVLVVSLSTVIFLILFVSNLSQPVVDQYFFRQCQTGITAYWFDWKRLSDSFFNYETPVFGLPWTVPFEFPLYQAIVSAVFQISGFPIEFAGRLTSLSFFLLTLLPLASLSKGFGMGQRFFFITAIFWLCSPLYLYWSRTVMIESTAVFFGFVFLAFVERAMASGKWQMAWWLAGFVASLACALVKVTTYPAFGLAALGILAWKIDPAVYKRIVERENLWRVMPSLLGIAVIGLATVATVSAWTWHTDSIKMQNQIAQSLTSINLESWNFGTLAQKTDSQNWLKLFDRCIPEAIGSYWVFGFMLGAGCFLNGKRAALMLGLLVLFLLPMGLFTNLHLVHSYYQYANSFWLVLALGLSVTEMSKRVPRFFTMAMILAILATQVHTYSQTYLSSTRITTSDAIDVGKFLAANSREDESVLVLGDDWSPEVAFHASRKAVYIPAWMPAARAPAFFETICNLPDHVFGPYRPAYLVINLSGLDSYPEKLRRQIDKFLIELGKSKNSPVIQIGGYELFKIEACTTNVRIETARSAQKKID